MIAGAKRREAAVKAAEEKTAAKAVETVETKAVKAEPVAKTEPVKAEPVAEAAPKAAAVVSEVYVQYGVMEWKTDELTEKAKAAYAAEGNTAAVASVKLYIKPEERKAYYVINDTATGSIEL